MPKAQKNIYLGKETQNKTRPYLYISIMSITAILLRMTNCGTSALEYWPSWLFRLQGFYLETEFETTHYILKTRCLCVECLFPGIMGAHLTYSKEHHCHNFKTWQWGVLLEPAGRKAHDTGPSSSLLTTFDTTFWYMLWANQWQSNSKIKCSCIFWPPLASEILRLLYCAL